jgi:ABC-type branched-subunit amino acid transport system substrate-binding protein
LTPPVAPRRRLRLLVLLTLLALVASACGARVSDEQIEAAGGSGGFAAGSGTSSGDGSTASADGDTVAGGDASGDPAAAGGTDGGAASGGAATGDAGATAAPAGGNGGAVDVGITADTVVLGNVSTLSGPVPGLFQGAVVGAQAAVAYQNSKGGMFGRKFKLDFRDDQFDTGTNRSATTELAAKTFAMVGSFSLYDDAAKDAVARSGMPDVTYSLTSRRDLPNNFSIEPAKNGGAPLAPFNYFGKKFPQEIKAVGTIFSDIPSSKQSAEAYKAAAQSVGWNFVYERGVQATETDFTADVVRMRQSGVKLVYAGALDDKTLARLLKGMSQQGFKVPVVTTGIGYDPDIPKLAGAGSEGMYTWAPYSLFGGEDAGSIPEVKLFNEWVQKVKPGFVPDLYTAFAWSSGRLLFQAMEKAGAKAKRADVVAVLKTITNFSNDKLLAPAGPGNKQPPTCGVVSVIKGGRYERFETPPGDYRCNDGGYFQR